eukprot:CAMPEP_0174857026 /NCGR_PEP_ID=MMETSP1114-20130205/37152_1 /TAXON_ID=312471 /ORGANISM="Neobodo designis, Strain CCAP 1951/1" /LENGTH=179 /DNA_ID=CAMNT_0016091851 /DNA_START=134 /DNA_END=673 /DNA_ORIENTATION=-
MAQMPMLVALARDDRRSAEGMWEVVNLSEQALAQDSSTRCCPHCRAPFTSDSGGSSMMRCGNPCCGRRFNYASARRYSALVPTCPTEAFEKSSDRGVVPWGIKCAGCAVHLVEGTRFQSLNCRSALIMCRRCFVHRQDTHADAGVVFFAVMAPAVTLENVDRRQQREQPVAEGGCCIVC